MNDTSLRTLLNTQTPHRDHASAVRPHDDSDYRAFAYGRIHARPQLMIEFIKTDGFHLVLPYMDLKSMASSDPAKGFVLDFHHRKVIVEGNNLIECFRYLRENRLSMLIEEGRGQTMSEPSTEPTIHRIAIAKA